MGLTCERTFSSLITNPFAFRILPYLYFHAQKGATLRRKWAFFSAQISYEKAHMGRAAWHDSSSCYNQTSEDFHDKREYMVTFVTLMSWCNLMYVYVLYPNGMSNLSNKVMNVMNSWSLYCFAKFKKCDSDYILNKIKIKICASVSFTTQIFSIIQFEYKHVLWKAMLLVPGSDCMIYIMGNALHSNSSITLIINYFQETNAFISDSGSHVQRQEDITFWSRVSKHWPSTTQVKRTIIILIHRKTVNANIIFFAFNGQGVEPAIYCSRRS